MRLGCGWQRTCFRVKGVDLTNIAVGNEGAVDVDCHLNRAVTHLFLNIGRAGALLNEKRSKGMSKCVEGHPANPRCFQTRQKVAIKHVAAIQWPADLGGEYQF